MFSGGEITCSGGCCVCLEAVSLMACVTLVIACRSLSLRHKHSLACGHEPALTDARFPPLSLLIHFESGEVAMN